MSPLTPAAAPSISRPGIGSLAALLAGVCLLVFGTNLQGVLLPLLGHERGSGMVAISLFSAGWSAGFVFACFCIGSLLGALGHSRTFALLALVSAICALLLSALHGDTIWIGLRVVIGFCYGGLSAIVESWLVELAGSGIAFASYMIVNLLASLFGTLSLNLINPLGHAPFILTAAAIALSVLPIMLSRAPRPEIPQSSRPHLLHLIGAAPVGAVGCLVVGLITGALGGLAPLFGMMSGLNMRNDTFMLAANSIGGALAYAPIGMLGERVDRRTLLQGIGVFGFMICLALVLLPSPQPATIIFLLGAFGFAQYPLYGLCVGIACARLPGQPASQTISELLLLFGIGTITGPLIAGQVMHGHPQNLFSFIAAALVLLTVCATADKILNSGHRVRSVA